LTEDELSMSVAGGHVSLAEWLTVERAAYAAVGLVGLGLRLLDLAGLPLTPAEAMQALPAWQAAGGRAYDLAGISPLLFNLQRFAFIPFGGADQVARAWPALFGGLAPLLFYALRDRLGRGGALAAAALWACSPMAVFVGRLGLGFGLVPPLALALLATLNLCFGERTGPGEAAERGAGPSGGQRWLIWAAIALGTMLAAGPGAYTVLLIGIVAAFIWRPVARALWEEARVRPRPVALAAGAALVLGATGFLIAPSGLASVADLVGRWVRDLLPGAPLPLGMAAGYSVWDLLRQLLISEPLLLGAALGGAALAWRRRDAFGKFAALAAGLTLLVPVAGPGRQPGDLGLAVMALTLLAGPAVAWILRTAAGWRREVDAWLLLTLSLALLIASAIGLASTVNPYQAADQNMYLIVAFVTAALAVGLWIVFGALGNWDLVWHTLPALAFIWGAVWGVSQLTGINFQQDPDRFSGAQAQVPADGWPLLNRQLNELTGLFGTGAREVTIDLWNTAPLARGSGGQGVASVAESPLMPMLEWELKNYPNLQVIQGPAAASPAAIIITPLPPGTAPTAQVGVPSGYSGTGFDLLASWQPDSLSGFAAWLRWLLYRETGTPSTEWPAVLWVDWSTAHTAAQGGLTGASSN